MKLKKKYFALIVLLVFSMICSGCGGTVEYFNEPEIIQEDQFLFSHGESEKYNRKEFAPYNNVLKTYYTALLHGWDEEEIDKNKLTKIVLYYDGKNRMAEMGYCFIDLDCDGINELLIGEVPHDNYEHNEIYDLYTVKDGKVHQVALGWERCRLYIYKEEEGYRIVRSASSGAGLSSDDHYILENGDLKHEWSVVMNAFADEKNPWFLADNDELNVTNEMRISKEKYMELVDVYKEKYIMPNFISFETLE